MSEFQYGELHVTINITYCYHYLSYNATYFYWIYDNMEILIVFS